jgi:hypothetical protein
MTAILGQRGAGSQRKSVQRRKRNAAVFKGTSRITKGEPQAGERERGRTVPRSSTAARTPRHAHQFSVTGLPQAHRSRR